MAAYAVLGWVVSELIIRTFLRKKADWLGLPERCLLAVAGFVVMAAVLPIAWALLASLRPEPARAERKLGGRRHAKSDHENRFERGAGDISYVTHLIPGLDGLGAIGGRAHAPGEFVDLKTLPQQIKRAALLIYRLTR